MSVRAPSTGVAVPMKTLPFDDDAGSPAIGSRQIATLVMPMSSTTQPVTGSAPTTPVELSTGVSRKPRGAVVAAMTLSCTGTVIGEFGTPGAVIVSVAVFVVPFGYDPALTETLNVPLPLPDAGVIVSHVWSDVTVHV